MGKPGNLLPLLSQMAVGRQKPELKVFGNDYPTPYVQALSDCMYMSLINSDGTCVRDYLHVTDLADGHVLALDALDKGAIFDQCKPTEGLYRAFNLGKGKGMSVLNMVEAMRAATGFDYKYDIVERR